ncbi:MAG: DUF5700 domain-containing putative Zn-dependent protease [Cyclobacteriaceae bacterium]
MKFIVFTALFSISLVACTQLPEDKVEQEKIGAEVNIESALQVIQIAKEIAAGKKPDEYRWIDLFKSEGYRHYLIYADSLQKKSLIKESLINTFDDSKSATLDSLLALPILMNRDYFRLSLIHNFNRLKNNLTQIERFLEKTDFEKVLLSADSLAQNFLPDSSRDSLPRLYPVYVVVSDPDGSVQDEAIIVDLNLMMQMGELGLIEFIAHEFHHNYRKIASKEYSNPLMIELNRLHQEAVADLIDKKQPPISELAFFPESILQAYNKDYLNTPSSLKVLDSLVLGYMNNVINDSIFQDQISYYFKFGGHTNGIYMSFLIDREVGKEELIATYDQPVAFIKLYNSVATKKEGEYAFSDEFIEYISNLEE